MSRVITDAAVPGKSACWELGPPSPLDHAFQGKGKLDVRVVKVLSGLCP